MDVEQRLPEEVDFVVLEICVLPTSSLRFFSPGQEDLVPAFHLQVSDEWRFEEGFKSVYSVHIIELLRRLPGFLLRWRNHLPKFKQTVAFILASEMKTEAILV